MFKVIELDGGPSMTVYAVTTDNLSGDIMFLIWDDHEGEWDWVYAGAYGPAEV
jgi:hypothetical protein